MSAPGRETGSREIAELVERAFIHSPGPQAILDGDRRIIVANDAFAEMLGAERSDLATASFEDLVDRRDITAVFGAYDDLAGGDVHQVRCPVRLVHRGNNSVSAVVSIARFNGRSGDERLVVLAHDVTGESAAEADLTYQAYHDPLTGLANRALFEDRLSRALGRCRSGGGAGALLLVDLDDFKGVNDTLGHHVGDELLVAFAERLRRATRTSDTLCRFGGDEFLVLAEDLSSSDDLERLARRVMSVLETPFAIGGTTVTQSASAGVVPLSPELSARSLFEFADTTMYEAKRLGKSRWVVFDPEMHARAVLHFELAQELRGALEGGELSMDYQPLVDITTSKVVGLEALMRWRHPKRGVIEPAVFIELAEQSELIFELGAFALREATLALMSLTATLRGRRPYIAVNISTRQLYDPHLVRVVEDALTASGLTSDRLVLEITESAALGDLDASSESIQRLLGLGVRIAIDDFGTGYSSLSYLPRLFPKIIKIDRSFVSGFPLDPDRVAMLEGVISLSHTLGATVVAEGVETEGELACLRQLGCEVGQGYVFSPALPLGELPGLLARWD